MGLEVPPVRRCCGRCMRAPQSIRQCPREARRALAAEPPVFWLRLSVTRLHATGKPSTTEDPKPVKEGKKQDGENGGVLILSSAAAELYRA
jgi:hypothetical protein